MNFAQDFSGKLKPACDRAVDKAVSKAVWSRKIYGDTVEATTEICKSTILKLRNDRDTFHKMPPMPPVELVVYAPMTPEKKKFIADVEGVIAEKANEAKVAGKT